MKLLLPLLLLMLGQNLWAKEYIIKDKKTSLKVNVKTPNEFEAKEKFLNTPLLIWSKELKHHGPSVALFPLNKLPKHALSKGAQKSNFDSFQKNNRENLGTLKASELNFSAPRLEKDRVIYAYNYILPGNIKVYALDILKECKSGGLKIKSVIRSKDHKKYGSIINELINGISCK
ncbi:hypothetical protein BIY24_07210 [Halobacteriovorax marinus]|uniref:hypothetical protein n=1 Tax=Halobacteriovorax marinus TaxID=97084 RepID=UPI000BC3143A|nr:hypothetical protein [Halobacteriovorax marinus]ATH07740.1 hypothetical protein BIY24_07210 [Halobacteriovorax marinus]